MEHINRALNTKTGKPQGMVARKIHGQIRAYLEDYPDEAESLATYFDLAPQGWKPQRYVAYMRSRVSELRNEKQKQQEGSQWSSRANTTETLTEVVQRFMSDVVSAGKTSRRKCGK